MHALLSYMYIVQCIYNPQMHVIAGTCIIRYQSWDLDLSETLSIIRALSLLEHGPQSQNPDLF
jgi:hypothetical protein